MKKRYGDRKDATKIRDIDGVHKFMYHLLPKRCDNEVHIYKNIDVTNMIKYYEKKKKDNDRLTYFHVFVTAIGKIMYKYPHLNDFVVGGNFYKRDNVSVSFVAKKQFTTESKECLTSINIDKKDNIDKISKKILSKVDGIRNDKENNTDSAVDIVGKLPKLLRSIIVSIIKLLDKHDKLPNSLIEGSIYHSSVLVSNLGSIGCGAIYHHLSEFGTNSIIVTIGEVRKEVVVKEDKESIRYMCEFGITLDERIKDGFYFAKAVNYLDEVLNNPEVLEEDIDDRECIR